MFDNNCMLCVGQQRTVCTLLPCSIVLFSAVNVHVFYEQINDVDDDFQRPRTCSNSRVTTSNLRRDAI